MSRGGKLAAIVARHVEAAVAELRAAVEAEIREAIAGLAPNVPAKARRLPQERAAKRARPSAPGSRKSKATRSSGERSRPAVEPPQPAQRTCSECDQPGHNARTCSQRVRSAVAPVVDTARADRFAKLEERVKARTNGAVS